MNEERHDTPDQEESAPQADGEETPIEHGPQQGATRGSSNQGGPEQDQALKVGGRHDQGSRSSLGRGEPPQPASPAETTPEALRGPLPPGAEPEDDVGGKKPHKTRSKRKTRGASGVRNEVVSGEVRTQEVFMRVREIMSNKVACCLAETSLPEVARMMVDNDCGEIPVVDASGAPIGVVTDRDIVCRVVAKDENALLMNAADCMTSPCVTVTPQTSLEKCCETLERNRIRRVVVVDGSGACCGIVAQADIARHAPKAETAQVVKQVSQPAGAAQALGL